MGIPNYDSIITNYHDSVNVSLLIGSAKLLDYKVKVLMHKKYSPAGLYFVINHIFDLVLVTENKP